MSKPDAAKVLVLTIVLGIAAAIGMYLLVHSITQSSREAALRATNAEVDRGEKRGPSMLEAAAAVASSFVGQVGGGRYPEAYALMARPYRDAVAPAAFAKTCRASSILSAARAVTLNRLRQQSTGTAATIEASGVLDSGAGAVPIGFVFLQDGGQLRILVVSLAGVPVLQGVTPQ